MQLSLNVLLVMDCVILTSPFISFIILISVANVCFVFSIKAEEVLFSMKAVRKEYLFYTL